MGTGKMDDWKMDGKPALVLLHMQQGLVGKGSFIPGWFEPATFLISIVYLLKELIKKQCTWKPECEHLPPWSNSPMIFHAK